LTAFQRGLRARQPQTDFVLVARCHLTGQQDTARAAAVVQQHVGVVVDPPAGNEGLQLRRKPFDPETLLMRLAEGLELGDLIVTDPNEVGPLHPGEDGNIKQLGHLADKPHALSDTP